MALKIKTERRKAEKVKTMKRFKVVRTYEVKKVVETVVEAASPEEASGLAAPILDKEADDIDLQAELTQEEAIEEIE